MPFIIHKNFQKNVYTINQTDLVRVQPNNDTTPETPI